MASTNIIGTAVTPVVDYEPQIGTFEPECSPPSSAALRRPATRADHLRAVHPRPGVQRAEATSAHRSAAAFADAALRTVLEVIDLRRPATQLRPLMGSGLADSVIAFTRAGQGRRAAAVLRRTRLQACGADERTFEVAAAYSRQSRLHAIACRIEQVRTPQGTRWQLVALHMG
jgi:Family of unknown function (DUF6459)